MSSTGIPPAMRQPIASYAAATLFVCVVKIVLHTHNNPDANARCALCMVWRDVHQDRRSLIRILVLHADKAQIDNPPRRRSYFQLCCPFIVFLMFAAHTVSPCACPTVVPVLVPAFMVCEACLLQAGLNVEVRYSALDPVCSVSED